MVKLSLGLGSDRTKRITSLITLSLVASLKRGVFACLQLGTLIFALSHLIKHLGDFFRPNYAFHSFSHLKHVGLFAAKLGCSGLDLTKSNVFPFFSLNYAVFGYMTPKRIFCLFVSKFTLFLVLTH